MGLFFRFSLAVAAVIFSLIAISSCSVEKRRFRPGYYLEWTTVVNPVPHVRDAGSGSNPDPDFKSTPVSIFTDSTDTVGSLNFYNSLSVTENAIVRKTDVNHLKIKSPERSQKVVREPLSVQVEEKFSQVRVSGKDSDLIYVSGFGLVLLINLLFFRLFLKSGRQLAIWASKNKIVARSLLFGLKLIFIGTGIWLGEQSVSSGIIISPFAISVVAGLWLITGITYPGNKPMLSFFKKSFVRRKVHNLLLGLCGLFLVIGIVNRFSDHHNVADPDNSHFIRSDASTQEFTPLLAGDDVVIRSGTGQIIERGTAKNSLRNLFINILKILSLIILLVITEFIIIIITCFLSCYLWLEAAAIIFFYTSTVLNVILFLFLIYFWVIRPILKKRKLQETPT